MGLIIIISVFPLPMKNKVCYDENVGNTNQPGGFSAPAQKGDNDYGRKNDNLSWFKI